MKKILSLTLCLVLALTTIPMAVITANAETYGDYSYEVLDDGTVLITGYNGSATDLTIPSEIDGKTVISIGDNAFEGCTSLENVTIPDSVISVGENAFYNTAYYNDKSNWENYVLYLGKYLIATQAEADGFFEVDYTIKNGTTVVCDGAFTYAILKSISIPESVINIGKYAFSWCSLESINVDSNNKKYKSVDGILFNKDLTELIKYPSENLQTTYIVPDSVLSIGAEAFVNCESLTSITIPSSVTSIDSSSFYTCDSLIIICYPGSYAEKYAKEEDFNYSYIDGSNEEFYYDYKILDNGTIEITGYNGSDTKITIPSLINSKSVTSIGYGAFEDCTSLTSITIPDSVTSIGEYAFAWCESLASVTTGNNVTSIGDMAFYDTAYYNDEANWENGALYIGKYLISGKLEKDDEIITEVKGNYSIKSGTKVIAPYAFSDCGSLTNITIPNSVTCIGEGTFIYCTSLTSIAIPDSVTRISYRAFEYCSKLTNITIPDSITSIDYYAFCYCTSLTSVTIGNSVTSISGGAFYGCSSLTSITIPDSVTSIGGEAFYGCYSLTSVTIPDSVTSIGSGAFNYRNQNLIIYGYKGSETEKYADDHGIEFVSIGCYHKSTKTENQKSATCTEAGYTGDKVCTVCGETIEKGEEISALGHTLVTKNAKKATYFVKGYAGDKVCTVCGKTVTKGKTIAKLMLKTPKITVKAGSKLFKVKYAKVTGATGFQLRYKLNGKWIVKNYNTKKTVTKKIKKLKKGKKYTVQVRAFVKSGSKTAYSSWTKAKKITVN